MRGKRRSVLILPVDLRLLPLWCQGWGPLGRSGVWKEIPALWSGMPSQPHGVAMELSFIFYF